MQDRKLLITFVALASFAALAGAIALTTGSPQATAGPSETPTATQCPIHTTPDPEGEGCIKVTQTNTPTPIPCPTDMVYDPYLLACVPNFPTPIATPCPTHSLPVKGGCATITPTYTATPCPWDTHPNPKGPGCVSSWPTETPTPCPTHSAPVQGACATITPTPTSQRPYGASIQLISESPDTAVSGRKKQWVFEIENTGSSYGCEAHQVDFYATLGGLVDAQTYYSRGLHCHETALVTVSSVVTSPPGGTIDIDARVTAGASPIIGHFMEVETVVAFGDLNCDGAVNAIDAQLILQIEAGLPVPLPCTGDGDANHDGELSSLDAVLILQYVAGLIPAFP